jgi:hypothetical protein
MTTLKNHDLVPEYACRHIRYEERPVLGRNGKPVEGLHQVWLWLDNEEQLNSYTTEAVKEVILALRWQHRGVRQLLRGPPTRIPAVHAAVQRHGHRAHAL